MPKIKLREPRLTGAPQATGARRISVGAVTQVARADQDIAQAASKFAPVIIQIRDEHDANVSKEAYNSFRDATRKKKDELRSLRGTDADGAMEDYNQWEKKNRDQFGSHLNKRQRRLYDEASERKRQTDLDTISGHQAEQHRIATINSKDAYKANSIQDIYNDPENLAMSDDTFDEDGALIEQGDISRGHAEIDAANPGFDNTIEKLKYTADYRAAQIQGMLDRKVDPRIIKEHLDNWKSQLGGAYDKYKTKIESENVRVESQEEADKLLIEFPDDIDAAIDKAQDTLEGQLEDATVTRLRAEQTQRRLSKQEDVRRNNKIDNDWAATTGDLLLEQDELTLDIINAAPISDEAKGIYETKMLKQGEKRNKQDLVELSKQEFADWSQIVSLEPHKWSDLERYKKEIRTAVDPNNGGLTGREATFLEKELIFNRQTTTPKGIKATQTKSKALLKAVYERGDFGRVRTGKKKQKADSWKTYTNLVVELQEWVIANPQDDPTEWLKGKFNEQGEVQADSWLDSLAGFIGGFTGGALNQSQRSTIIEELDKAGIQRSESNIQTFWENNRDKL